MRTSTREKRSGRLGQHVQLIATTVTLCGLLMPLCAFGACPPQGDAHSARVRHLNTLKNRMAPPPASAINPRITLAAILTPGDDSNRWSDSEAATIIGYVVDVHPGGTETVNCKAHDLAHRDTHIEIALHPGVPESERMIVEITPRWRTLMLKMGMDWSTHTLEHKLTGHWVTFTGWMFFDAEHENASENTSPGRNRDWRGTAWEIHPITVIQSIHDP